ncbi:MULTISPECIES: SH3 domain-containing protein [Rhizobium/Agrobacterium group]|uniref:SH3 domain-containing protein n=1 Tax=Rhizobium/Agrobacterium group TaxID=227290 RepID=UPI0022BBAF6A|nr:MULTISPECIES: SH3 domain-containing protein [Rhizobium/Agrobacterium group]MCZ7464456.1 SH3 domain-containing protein [Rhizobium rhizogenes]MDA5633372.1 SH3 domain-containing protein [Agrobacterium sp. ST15.16.024]MDF1889016.1 SH3 domain-containing protein [Rhizobium rhizogenes]MDO3443834.1 SH3 domain-containing protein [Agrobacterium sp. V1]
MKRKLFGAIALVAMLAAPALAEAATRGFATANVNMRSGPSTAYPAVVVIPNGAPLTVHGCLSDTPWCDVSFVAGRGWVAGRYIQTTYRQNRVYVEPRYYRDLGVPIITFEAGRYWDRYYRDRDFYRERDRWRRPSGGYWNVAPPPRADWDRPRPRDEWRDGRRDDWRDGRRDDWRDGRRDESRDPRQGGGPNDGRWERRYGDWNQGDRNQGDRNQGDRPRREDNRPRAEDDNRDRNRDRQANQDEGQRRPERRQWDEQRRAPGSENFQGGCRIGDPGCDAR